MPRSDDDREQAIRDAGGVETYRLRLLEAICERLDGEGDTAAQTGTLETISSYKTLPEAPCSAVTLHNANDDLLRWRLADESGTGNPLPAGQSVTVPVPDASAIEVRGAETGMDVVWIASA
jgi:hypothetical protein